MAAAASSKQKTSVGSRQARTTGELRIDVENDRLSRLVHGSYFMAALTADTAPV